MSLTLSVRKEEPAGDILSPDKLHMHDETVNAADPFWGDHYDEGRLAVDVYETEKDIVLQSAIAGVEFKDLEVFLHNDMLTIRGKRVHANDADARYMVRECHWGGFSRTLILPAEIDSEEIHATLKNGILTVRMPKVRRSQHIPVKEL